MGILLDRERRAMKIFNKIKKSFNLPIITLQKVQPKFRTTDGVDHYGHIYKWANKSGLSSKSVEKYVMIGISSDGYIRDDVGIIYPLTNVISIKWEIIKEIRAYGDYHHYHGIYFTDEEVNNMKIVYEII